jgi:hypothetical protein
MDIWYVLQNHNYLLTKGENITFFILVSQILKQANVFKVRSYFYCRDPKMSVDWRNYVGQKWSNKCVTIVTLLDERAFQPQKTNTHYRI